jgi:hypothetical protein
VLACAPGEIDAERQQPGASAQLIEQKVTLAPLSLRLRQGGQL